jgi:hypothetical protein
MDVVGVEWEVRNVVGGAAGEMAVVLLVDN